MKKVSFFTFDVKGKIGKRVIETREDWAGNFEKMFRKSRQKTGNRKQIIVLHLQSRSDFTCNQMQCMKVIHYIACTSV